MVGAEKINDVASCVTPDLPGSGGLLSGGHLSRWGWKTRRQRVLLLYTLYYNYLPPNKKEKNIEEGNDPFVLLAQSNALLCAPCSPLFFTRTLLCCYFGAPPPVAFYPNRKYIRNAMPAELNFQIFTVLYYSGTVVHFLFFFVIVRRDMQRRRSRCFLRARLRITYPPLEIMKGPTGGLLHELWLGKRRVSKELDALHTQLQIRWDYLVFNRGTSRRPVNISSLS